jgi:hypothetical protein
MKACPVFPPYVFIENAQAEILKLNVLVHVSVFRINDAVVCTRMSHCGPRRRRNVWPLDSAASQGGECAKGYLNGRRNE